MIRKKQSILLTAFVAASSWSIAASADFGIKATGSDSGVIYFQDSNYSGSWNYICFSGENTADDCGSGTLVNGYWEREVSGLVSGASYEIEAKIQDNTIGQYLSGKQTVEFSAGSTTGAPTATATATNTDSSGDQGQDTVVTGPASQVYYIVHKATGKKVSSCGTIGDKVEMTEADSTSDCAKWEVVDASGKYFFLRGVVADGYIRPRGLSNGIPIMVQPTSWTGNYMQWSKEETGDGYFHLVNRQTKKFGYSDGSTFLQESKTWKGDWTRWQFVDAGSVGGTGTSTGTSTSTSTGTDTATTTDTSTATDTDTDTGSATSTDTGGHTDTDTGGSCGAPTPDVDPAKDLGEGFEAGLTTAGIAYHSEIAGAARGFAIWGAQGAAPNVSGQQTLYTDTKGNSYYRYEVDLGTVDPNTSYTLEMRLQGDEFNGGQCIQSFTVKPGEGLVDADCYAPTSGGGTDVPVEPVVEQTVSTAILNANQGLARLIAGPAAGDKAGYALYTFDPDPAGKSTCFNGCEDNWPKLVVEKPDDLRGAGGVNGKFATIERITKEEIDDGCGNIEIKEVVTYHVTYEGKPLYYFVGDQSASDVTGGSINNWSVAEATLIPQLPMVKHPHDSLLATVNGLTPSNMGYAIDIEGRTLTWRPSAINGNRSGLISQFSPWAGDGYPLSAKDPQLELWCSNNQIQFHKASMPGTLAGPYSASFPASCYGEFYFFLRYRIHGTVNNEPEDNWVYTALYRYDETKPNDRFDPRTRPTVTHKSANWQRIGHPHARDRVEEAILHDAMPYNSTPVSGLERYRTDFVDGPNEFQIQPHANGSILRIEAFEWGAGNCQGPQYIINANNPMAPGRFDYGQIISWEATFGSSQNNFPGGTAISSQVYNTMQNTTVGLGFSSATGDPRLNPVDRFGVRMVHSNGCNPVEKEERNARFAQQLTSVQSAKMVDDFVRGHNETHGLPSVSGARVGDTGLPGSKAVVSTAGKELSAAGMGSCGTCHFRDGRTSDVFNTPKGKLMGPAMYGTGLLANIAGAEVGLTWDGSQPSVKAQTRTALKNDLNVTPASIGEEVFERIVTYTRTLHVPVRDYSTYTDAKVAEGEVKFYEAGCDSCHQTSQKTKADAPVELANITLRPYTDMKLWDIGTGDGAGPGKGFRTAPLWGLGQNISLLERNGKDVIFMHDGSAKSLSAAIDQHGNGSVTGLSGSDKELIITFLKSL